MNKKQNKHIEMLKEYDWFNDVYYNPKYTRLFKNNKQIRSYLGRSSSIRKMIRKRKVSNLLITLLENQVKKQK